MLLSLLFLLIFHLLPIFALTTSPYPPLTLTNTTSPTPFQFPHATCYSRRLNPHLSRLDLINCNVALELLTTKPDLHTSRRWSHPDPITLIVSEWHAPGCSIALVAKTDRARDIFKPDAIATAAATIMLACLVGGAQLGGWVTVGKREVFDVVIAERVPVLAAGEGEGEGPVAGIQEARRDGLGYGGEAGQAHETRRSADV